MKILSGISLVAALLMAGAATPSFATSLPTNGTLVVPNTVATFTGFSTLASTGPVAYSYGAGADTGVYAAAVGTYAGNPFGASDLTFVYQVEVTKGDIQHVAASDFSNLFSYDVAQAVDGGTVGATNASWNFDVIEFNFPGPGGAITPGEESYVLIINTNAKLFTAGTVGLIDGGGTTVAGYMPTNTPEPSTLSLLGTGLLAVGAGLRRKMLRK